MKQFGLYSIIALVQAVVSVNGNTASGIAYPGSNEIQVPFTAPQNVHESNVDNEGVGAWNVVTHGKFPGYALRSRVSQKLCDQKVKQVVGYLDAPGDKHFFFWFFESRSNPSTDPLVMWLNGGPGCSSSLGLLMELGPCRVNDAGNGTFINKFAWNNKANLLFLDQPVNVGFSYSNKTVDNTDSSAKDTDTFIQLLLKARPQYAELPFYITGESYAGVYVPAIAHAVVQGNRDAKELEADGEKSDRIDVNLVGVAMGNGHTDPMIQYETYADYAEEKTYGPVLSADTIKSMRESFPACKALMEECYKYRTTYTCVRASQGCSKVSGLDGPFAQTGRNVYDVRMPCDASNPLCYPIINAVETYLNTPAVQRHLGVNRTFQTCNGDVGRAFSNFGDGMVPYVQYVPRLLDAGVRVLVYAGDADYICNWVGNKAWTLAMPWSGQDAYRNATDRELVSRITRKPLGVIKVSGAFAFLRVYNAGHMVPYDQPEHALEMINRFIKQE